MSPAWEDRAETERWEADKRKRATGGYVKGWPLVGGGGCTEIGATPVVLGPEERIIQLSPGEWRVSPEALAKWGPELFSKINDVGKREAF